MTKCNLLMRTLLYNNPKAKFYIRYNQDAVD